MIFPWLDAVDRAVAADATLTNSRRTATLIVAATRARHANPDGTNCYPSQARIAAVTYLKRDTVGQVDRWLLEQGLMRVEVRQGRGIPKRMRLVIPPATDGRDDDHPSDEWMPLTGDNQQSMDAPMVAPMDAPDGGHNLQPLRLEEEEGADAGVADAPPPALVSGVAAISREAGFSLDPAKLAAAMRGALERTSWSSDELEVYCVEALKQNRRRIDHPDGWLRAHLERNARAGVTKTPRMVLAGVLEEMDALYERLPDDLASDEALDPMTILERRLIDDELVANDGRMVDAWTPKPAKIEAFIDHAKYALSEVNVAIRKRGIALTADEEPMF